MFMLFFYAGSVVILFLGSFYFNRKEEAEELFRGIFFAILFVMLFQVVCMGILDIFTLKVNCYFIGAINWIVGGCTLYHSIKKSYFQKYIVSKTDIIANFIIIAFVFAWGFLQFGFRLNWFHYETVDIGKHILRAFEVCQSGSVKEMFFAQGQIGLWLQSLTIFKNMDSFRVSIIFELVILYLSGVGFWYAIKIYISDIFSKIFGIILTGLYFFGYTACGELFGSQYLVCGIMLITALIVVFNDYIDGAIKKKYAVWMMMLLCCGITLSYAQFCPVVFTSLGIGIIIQEKSFKKKIITGLKVFMLPCIFAILFVFADLIGPYGISILGAEGYI